MQIEREKPVSPEIISNINTLIIELYTRKVF